QHGHAPEAPHDLPGPRDAEAADALGPRAGDVGPVEHDPPLVGMEHAADAVEERGLAGAVGSDQPHDLAWLDGERDVTVGHEPSDAPGARLDLEQRGHRAQALTEEAGARPRRRAAHSAQGSESRPLGRQPAMSMITAP